MPREVIGLTIPAIPDNSTIVLPKIRTLFSKMLAKARITNRQSLDSYIATYVLPPGINEIDVANPSHDGMFRVVSGDDLEFDVGSECRLFLPHVECRDTILSVPELNLRNSRHITFTKCIITGNVRISMSEGPVQTIYLDGCLVLGKLMVEGVCNGQAKIEISRLNSCSLALHNLQIESVSIDMCRLPTFYFTDSQVQRVLIRGNAIKYVRLFHTNFHTSDVDHAQFNLKHLCDKPNDSETVKASSDLFNIIDDLSWGDTPKEELFQTLEFLKKHTALSSDRRSFNIVRLIEGTLYQKSRNAALAMRLLGAMQRPALLFKSALAVLLASALIYWKLLPMGFVHNGNTVVSLNLSEACYFSGVTMMTIGYGDYVPLGFARWVAIAESICGVSLWGLFIVALTRKYVD